MDLATDMNKDGFYYYINDRRNAITHRFVSIHSETITMGKKNKDIPCFSINEFENELIKVLQLLKSAIIYLIIFVDKNERKNEPSEFVLPVFFDVIDKSLRWKPNNIL